MYGLFGAVPECVETGLPPNSQAILPSRTLPPPQNSRLGVQPPAPFPTIAPVSKPTPTRSLTLSQFHFSEGSHKVGSNFLIPVSLSLPTGPLKLCMVSWSFPVLSRAQTLPLLCFSILSWLLRSALKQLHPPIQGAEMLKPQLQDLPSLCLCLFLGSTLARSSSCPC